MAELRYIPHGAFLVCDKGSTPTQIQVTHDNGGRLYDQKLVSEADLLPGENIMPMGACAVTNSACAFAPLYWDKCNPNAKLNGFKLVYQEACLLCTVGGKIQVSYETPPSVLAEMEEEAGPGGEWVTGAGIGSRPGLVLADRSAPFSSQAAGVRPQLDASVRNTPNGPKGVFGEAHSTLDLQAKGYDIASSPISRPQPQGIDLIGRDSRAGIYLLDETKFVGNGTSTPRVSSELTASGRQGSTRWFRDRLPDHLPAADAARVDARLATGSPMARTMISRVGPDGAVTRFELTPAGRTGPQITLPPAAVVGGNSRAANLINGVSDVIQTTGAVSDANRWLTTNAHNVSRVGKVVGSGAFVLGIGMDAIAIGSAYREEGEFGDKTQAATGSAVGALAGGAAGAKVGAVVGAVGGPVGIVVGGVVGGAIGGLVGSGAGRWVAGWF